jgi:hypothetical protein
MAAVLRTVALWIVGVPLGLALIVAVVAVGTLHLALNWIGFGLHWLCANLTAPILGLAQRARDEVLRHRRGL